MSIGEGCENLWLFGRLYQLPGAEARRRADHLLGQFALGEAADRLVGQDVFGRMEMMGERL